MAESYDGRNRRVLREAVAPFVDEEVLARASIEAISRASAAARGTEPNKQLIRRRAGGH